MFRNQTYLFFVLLLWLPFNANGQSNQDELKKRCSEGSLFATPEDGASFPGMACVELVVAARGDKTPQKTVADLEPLCASGAQDSCLLLAEQLMRAMPPAQDRKRAVGLLEKGCESKHYPSCAALGWYYNDVVQNKEKGLKATKEACRSGYFKACHWVAELDSSVRMSGLPGKGKRWSGKFEFNELACQSGSAGGCYRVALSYKSSGRRTAIMRKRKQVALQMLEKLCGAGVVEACESRAYHYKEWEKNKSEAKKFYQMGLDHLRADCDAGASWSCIELGSLRQYGARIYGIVEGKDETTRYAYGRACDLQYRCSKLANWLSLHDDPQVRDVARALEVLDVSCKWNPSDCELAESLRFKAGSTCAQHIVKSWHVVKRLPKDKAVLKVVRIDIERAITTMRRCKIVSTASVKANKKLARRTASYEKLFDKINKKLGYRSSSTGSTANPAKAEACVRARCVDCVSRSGLARYGGNRDKCLKAHRRCMANCGCNWRSCSGNQICCP